MSKTNNSNTNKKIAIGVGIALLLGLGVYFFYKYRKNKLSQKDCESKGGTWDKNTKTCKLPPPQAQDVIAKVYDNLNFKTGSDIILATSYSSLDEMAKYLMDNPTMSIKITGHTDSKGDDAYNLELSKKRADSVKNYLMQKGVGEIVITTDGKGETEPIADNNTEEGRALNRRVVFEVTNVQ